MFDLYNGIGLFCEIDDLHSKTLKIDNAHTNYRLHSALYLYKKRGGKIFFVCQNDYEAQKYYDKLKAYIKNDELFFYPKESFYFTYADSFSRENSLKRIKCVLNSFNDKPAFIVTSVWALCEKHPFITKDMMIKKDITDLMKPEKLVDDLISYGYTREDRCEAYGQFALRGGIVDFFSPCNEDATRVEFFSDEIDSIRSFDPDTMLSKSNMQSFCIVPFCEYPISPVQIKQGINALKKDLEKNTDLIKDEEARQLSQSNFKELIEKLSMDPNEASRLVYSYLDSNELTLIDLFRDSAVLLCDSVLLKKSYELIRKNVFEDFAELKARSLACDKQLNIFIDYDEFISKILSHDVIDYSTTVENSGINYTQIIDSSCIDVIDYKGNTNYFLANLPYYEQDNYNIIITYNKTTNKPVKELLTALNVKVRENIFSAGVTLVECDIFEGMDFANKKIVIIPCEYLITQRKYKSKKAKRDITKEFFSDISPGDYVVHETYGIGKYEGIVRMALEGVSKDYVKISYAMEDVLYVPPEQMDLIQKYVGTQEGTARLSRLGSSDWQSTTKKVKRAVKELASEYLKMYAERLALKGYPFSKDTVWQDEFEDKFEFTPTEDQLKCSKEIKDDMEKPFPMDRLLLGDVGYGKTEVAQRAAFKAVMEPKQVAVLVPTTILALQHYNNFIERFKDYPIKIELICCFRSSKQIKQTIENLKTGKTDIVIGTHRLLSKDVVFNDLGLLIVDEEQRFGVAHKDKLKLMKTTVDTLTLSATPIPRTLNMSLSGIKDMSVINTPPEKRTEVLTYVAEQNDSLIRRAIQNEMFRNGQTFYLYNNVEHIAQKAQTISMLVPEARVAYAHGQMNEHELEKIIVDFLEKKFDVLVCTTIIENGVDIINANTMLIENADRLGLSQLYQLRGRVGRSDVTAYAYMFYKRDKVLSEVAQKRLKSIKEFTQFGSGFKIAMRDLQIRGAGNIMGANQHGHFANVGYEMYCRLLSEAVGEVSGKPTKVSYPCEIDIKADAYLPHEYVTGEDERIKLYKDIALIENEQDVSRMIDEITDVYSDMPVSVENLLKIALIKAKAKSVGIKKIRQNEKGLYMEFHEGVFLSADFIIGLCVSYKLKIKSTDKQSTLLLNIPNDKDMLSYCEGFLNDFICKSK